MAASSGVSLLGLMLLLVTGGGFFGPSDVVPLPEDPVVAQVAPAKCLFYSSWTGKKRASPDATSSTERLFANPKFLDYLQHVNDHLRRTLSQGIGAGGIGAGGIGERGIGERGIREEQVAGAFRLVNHLQSHAGSFYISAVDPQRNQPPVLLGGLVVRVDDQDLDPIIAALEGLLRLVPDSWQSTVQVGNSQFSRIEGSSDMPPISWGIQRNYLIVSIGAGEAAAIIERLHSAVPSWLVEAKQSVATPRPARFVHLDVRSLLETFAEFLESGNQEASLFAGVLEAFGLDALESFSYGAGLDSQGTVSRGLLKLSPSGKQNELTGGPSDGLGGMLTLLDCEPLVVADFQQISSTSPFAVVFQLNLADALTACLDALEHERAPPDAADTARQIRLQLERMRHALGIDILKELLASLGDTWQVFAQPGPQALTGGWTLSVDLADPAEFLKIHDELLQRFNNQNSGGGPVTIVSQQEEQAEFYSAEIAGFPFVPTWCIHQDRLWIATSPMSARRLLGAPAPAKTLAETDHVRPFLATGRRPFKLVHIDMAAVMQMALPLIAQQLDALPAGAPIDASLLPPVDVLAQYLRPTVIAVERTDAGVAVTHHGTLPSLNLGQAVPLLVGTTLPAVGGAGDAARLNQSRNNQKQIALALHNFASENGVFPAGYSANKTGKPLLSWRVHILPYIEAQGLYEQFHLDEPWDSPHNKKLIDQIPAAYRSPRSNVELGKTTYLGVGGADGIFVRPQQDDHRGIGMAQVTDGTSNTVMTVESSDPRAIVWTRPGDFAPAKEDPQKGLRVDPRTGMSLGFTDGSVLSVPKSVAAATLNAFFTKSGGEMVERP